MTTTVSGGSTGAAPARGRQTSSRAAMARRMFRRYRSRPAPASSGLLFSDGARRDPVLAPEQPAERAQAVEPDGEGDRGHLVAASEQPARHLQATVLQELHRGAAERAAEGAVEME